MFNEPLLILNHDFWFKEKHSSHIHTVRSFWILKMLQVAFRSYNSHTYKTKQSNLLIPDMLGIQQKLHNWGFNLLPGLVILGYQARLKSGLYFLHIE